MNTPLIRHGQQTSKEQMNGTRRIIVHLFTGSITLFIWELEEKNLKLEAVLERHSSTTWRLQTRRVAGQIQSSLNDGQEQLQVLDAIP